MNISPKRKNNLFASAQRLEMMVNRVNITYQVTFKAVRLWFNGKYLFTCIKVETLLYRRKNTKHTYLFTLNCNSILSTTFAHLKKYRTQIFIHCQSSHRNTSYVYSVRLFKIEFHTLSTNRNYTFGVCSKRRLKWKWSMPNALWTIWKKFAKHFI